MPNSKIILTTGANRGIGFSIVQALALRDPAATYILACRTHSSGVTAIAELQKMGVTAPLDIVQLDISEDYAIGKAKAYVESKYGHLDGLSSLQFPDQRRTNEVNSVNKQRWHCPYT